MKKGKAKLITLILLAIILIYANKGNQPKIVGYTYDYTSETVWEMAQKCCPSGMEIQDVIREIKEINGMQDSIVHTSMHYKVPIYETKGE